MTLEWDTGRFSAGVRVHLIYLQSELLPKLFILPLPLRWPLFSVYIPCMLVTLWIVIKGILGLLVPHPRKTGCHVTKAVLGKGRLIPNRRWRRPARHDVSLPMNSWVNTHSAKSQPLCVFIVCCQSLLCSIVVSRQFVCGARGRARAAGYRSARGPTRWWWHVCEIPLPPWGNVRSFL